MRFKTFSLLALAALTLAGCNEKSVAYGDANSIIAVMSPEMWAQVSENVYDALEQTIQTVRAEKTFTVTYQDPGAGSGSTCASSGRYSWWAPTPTRGSRKLWPCRVTRSPSPV